MKKLILLFMVAFLTFLTSTNSYAVTERELNDTVITLLSACAEPPSSTESQCSIKMAMVITQLSSTFGRASISLGKACYTVCMRPQYLPVFIDELGVE